MLFRNSRGRVRAFHVAAALTATSLGAFGQGLVGDLHDPVAVHIDQIDLNNLILGGRPELAYEKAFVDGDELFEFTYNALDGGGANVGQNLRYTRVPRADLAGLGEWLDHTPARITGPNAAACNECHRLPAGTAAGPAASNVTRDPNRGGIMGEFIQRNTPHLMGSGGLQRLAEEMTDELIAIREGAIAEFEKNGGTVNAALVAKGVSFGEITIEPLPLGGFAMDLDVDGVDEDLVVKPFQWKGTDTSLRIFNRGACHNEIGMQPVETTGVGVDGDGDGVADELTVGDQTGMAIYVAGQARPTDLVEMSRVGLIPPLAEEQVQAISRGFDVFMSTGCAECHVPSLTLDDFIYSEPSQNALFRDAGDIFPTGDTYASHDLYPGIPVTFDLTADQPDNQILGGDGVTVRFHLGAFRTNGSGQAVVNLFGDLKRHNMGPDLAEPIDDAGVAADVWMTENLWGLGSTAPYLHDGRATTITEAILWHGGDALVSRDDFVALSTADQADMIAFLDNLRILKLEEEE